MATILVSFVILAFVGVHGQRPIEIVTTEYYILGLYGDKVDHGRAKASCESINAWLVEVKNEEVAREVQRMTAGIDGDVWIGVSFYNGLEWDSSTPIRFMNWSSNARGGEFADNYCVKMMTGGSWSNVSCTMQYQYICQSDPDFQKTILLTYFKSPKKSFSEAKAACAEYGNSTLVDITFAQMNKRILQRMRDENIQYFWTGGNDIEHESIWEWGDGTPINVEDTAWLKWPGDISEPNGGRGENCLAMMYRVSLEGWADINCNTSHEYICQKNYYDSKLCLNGATQTVVEKRYHCGCTAGYFGTKCENDMLEISLNSQHITANKGERVSANLTLKSYDENSTLVVTNETRDRVNTMLVNFPLGETRVTVSLPLGVQLDDATYLFTVTPQSDCYSRMVNLSVTVFDHCQSHPCQNGATCSYTTQLPYYICLCTPAYQGPECQDRTFITDGNCKYHVNSERRLNFADANSTCLNLGGSLAMIKSLDIQDLLENQTIDQYGSAGSIELWVGGYKSNNVWLWMDGTEILQSGTNQKWVNDANDYMIISSRKSTRDNMSWFTKPYSQLVKGYFCEVAVINPCTTISCKNGGSCVATGCQNNCECVPGFNGELCQTDLLEISLDSHNISANKGQRVSVGLAVKSYDGNVTVVVANETGYRLSNKSIGFPSGGAQVTVSLPLGVQLDDTTYIFTVSPNSNSYSRTVNMSATIFDRCSMSPCENNGTCKYDTVSPYYTCNCSLPYTGVDCTGMLDPSKTSHVYISIFIIFGLLFIISFVVVVVLGALRKGEMAADRGLELKPGDENDPNPDAENRA